MTKGEKLDIRIIVAIIGLIGIIIMALPNYLPPPDPTPDPTLDPTPIGSPTPTSISTSAPT
ncbi:MAG: hypothetical protein ACNY01_13710 [Desulfobacteria bacterium]